MVDRGRDAADIFTLSTGTGGGAMARIGPVGTGLCLHFPSGGLRGGDWLGQDFINDGTPFPRNSDGALLLIGGQEFAGTKVVQERGKVALSQMAFGVFVPRSTVARDSNIWIKTRECSRTAEDGRVRCSVLPYLTEIEVIAGLGTTLHLGFNVGELLDFILGWTTIDIFNDDIESRKEKAKSNQAPEDTSLRADPQR